MSWTLTGDVEEYAAAVLPLLEAEPARHTIALTQVATARRPGGPRDAVYGWWSADGRVSGAVASLT